MQGSVRQRSIGSFELRVFTGVDPDTGKRCYRSKTVRGNRAEAERELAAMVDAVGRGPGVAARTTVRELLERWFAIAETGWAPATIRQTRSLSPPAPRFSHCRRLDFGRHRRPVCVPSQIRWNRWQAVAVRDAGPDPRRAPIELGSGDALGMDLGQPGGTRPSDRGSAEGDVSTDAGGVAVIAGLRC